jgi:DnaK suppressor protein
MYERELAEFKTIIKREQLEILDLKRSAKESEQAVTLDQSTVGRLSRLDAMRSQVIALEGKRCRAIQLTRIDVALRRIDDGEFGYCPSYDEEINRRRLQVDPANPYCGQCAAKL